jgi:hypothetical protein
MAAAWACASRSDTGVRKSSQLDQFKGQPESAGHCVAYGLLEGGELSEPSFAVWGPAVAPGEVGLDARYARAQCGE